MRLRFRRDHVGVGYDPGDRALHQIPGFRFRRVRGAGFERDAHGEIDRVHRVGLALEHQTTRQRVLLAAQLALCPAVIARLDQ